MVARGLVSAFLIIAAAAPAAAQEKQPHYWASIASGQAMTRTGPGKNYPGVWLYQRRDLPIRVVKKYEHWRLIEDPDGARGWARIGRGSPGFTIAVRPNDGAKVRYMAEHGVVGRIDKCSKGWCRIEIGKREGYIHTSDLWGVGENELVD